MSKLDRKATAFAKSNSDILILGEPGVGKRYWAKEIHNRRAKKSGLIIADGASAGYEDVLELLSGVSNQATIVIANVDQLAPHTMELLNVFLKKGRKEYTGVRVIFTAVEYTMDSFERFVIPPLRDRVEDLPELVNSVLQTLGRTLKKDVPVVQDDSLRTLGYSSWPGNVKELVAVLGKAMMISHGDYLELPEEFLNEHQHVENAIQHIMSNRTFVLDQELYLIEKLLIRRALIRYEYNQSKTAQIMGLTEANFRYRLKKFGLPSKRGVK